MREWELTKKIKTIRTLPTGLKKINKNHKPSGGSKWATIIMEV